MLKIRNIIIVIIVRFNVQRARQRASSDLKQLFLLFETNFFFLSANAAVLLRLSIKLVVMPTMWPFYRLTWIKMKNRSDASDLI